MLGFLHAGLFFQSCYAAYIRKSYYSFVAYFILKGDNSFFFLTVSFSVHH